MLVLTEQTTKKISELSEICQSFERVYLQTDKYNYQILYNEKHPCMILYLGELDDFTAVFKLDLVFTVENEVKFNVVRFTVHLYQDLTHYLPDEKGRGETLVNVQELSLWCIKYQEKNMFYDLSSNNCRRFMIELCNYLSIPHTCSYFEEEYFRWRKLTEKLSSK
eukprot:gene8444-269_t